MESERRGWYGSWPHGFVLVVLAIGFVVALLMDQVLLQWLLGAAILASVLAHPLRALWAAFTGRGV